MKSAEFLAKRDLPLLRSQIRLGSMFYSDYRNDMGFEEHSVCNFFDGLLDYVYELLKEERGEAPTWEEVIERADTVESMEEWFYCFEGFPFEEVKDDEDGTDYEDD